MKDRIEFRFTVSTAKVETKDIKEFAKFLKPFADKTLKVLTEFLEIQVNKEKHADEKTSN